ncbi:Ig-like domain-containing protein, partial [Algoriphagus aquatilis]
DAGGVTNTATATGQDPDGNEVSDDSGTANDNDDPTETAISQNAKISFVKSGEYNAASGTITYTFTVTNTGNVTVSGIEIDDEQIGVTGLAISPSTLAPGATGTATRVYTLTQSDIDAGTFTNTASVSGIAPNGNLVTDSDGDTQVLLSNPGISISKSASLTNFTKVGESIVYTFSVKNTGNVTLFDVVVSDPLNGLSPISPVKVNSLAPGVIATFTATYLISQADLENGSLVNTATVKASDPNGNEVSSTGTNTIKILAVTNVTVNEASPFVVFTVRGIEDQLISLLLSDGTAISADYGPGLEYFNGSSWVVYAAGTLVPLDGSGKLWVRTPIKQDEEFERAETFTLTASISEKLSAAGTATIKDDGTGAIFKEDGTEDNSAMKDDDRVLSVNDIMVSESSGFGIFSLSGASGQLIILGLIEGTATTSDFGPGIEYFDGTLWLPYTLGSTVQLDKDGKLNVRVPIIADQIKENAETFTLSVANTGGTVSKGVGTIVDLIAEDDNATVSGSTDGSTSVSGNVLDNDFISDGVGITLEASLVTDPTDIPGTFVLNTDGSFTFTPVPGFSGTVEIVYSACVGDPLNLCDTATLVIEVLELPDSRPDVNATYLGVPVEGKVSTNDDVPPGSTYGNPQESPENPDGAVLNLNSDGSYVFEASQAGVYNFTITVCSPEGSCVTSILTITVTIAGEPQPPILKTDLATVSEGEVVVIKTLANDASGRPDLSLNPASVTIVEQPKNGSVTIDPSTGNVTYTPNPGFIGKDTYIYSVCDSGNPALCSTAIQEVTVVMSSSPNIIYASDDFVLGTLGSTLSGNVLINDGSLLGLGLTVVPQQVQIPQGTLTLNSDGTFVFVTASGFFGPVQFAYRVCTTGENPVCVTATLYLLVAPNQLLAVMDNFQANEINGLLGGVAGNVLTNDLINGKPVKPSEVKIKVV